MRLIGFLLPVFLAVAPAATAGEARSVAPGLADSGTTRRVPFDGGALLGASTAPVTIIEFSSYACPFCRLYHRDTFPAIRRE